MLFLAWDQAVYGVVWAAGLEQQYSLLGGLPPVRRYLLRAAWAFSAAGVMLMAGSMSLIDIVDGQPGNFWIGTDPSIVGGLSSSWPHRQLNRTPFDLAEAEQELVRPSDPNIQYALGDVYFRRYVNLVVVSRSSRPCTLGGGARL